MVKPDDLDHALVPEIAEPYPGEMVGVHGDWAPLRDRCALLDSDDPWQFRNMRVTRASAPFASPIFFARYPRTP